MAFSPVRGTRLRATVTDECGVPSTGVGDSVITSGFITVSFSPEMRDRTEIELENAAGDICVSDTTKPVLKWYNVEIEFCKVDPELFAMLTGQEVISGHDATPIGFAVGSDTADTGFSLELWTDVAGQACAGGVLSYGYLLAPWLNEGVLGDFTLENDAITFTITARTNANHAWGTGPYDVLAADGANTPGPLIDALDPNRQLLLIETTIAPPAVPA